MKLCLWFIFLLLQVTPAFTQCNSGILITTDSIGNYTFTSTLGNDSSAQHLWLLNNDTLAADSSEIAIHLDSNGTYQLCLQITNTAVVCSFDTCIIFTENNAEYIPLLDSINIWHMFENICPVKREWEFQEHECSCTMFYTGNDTIINNTLYKKLHSTWMWSYPSLQGLIREDFIHRKIYFRYYDDSSEIVLYDFARRAGDSLRINFLQTGYSGTYLIDSLKTMFIANAERKVVFLHKASGWFNPLTWVEGIGSLYGPIYPYSYYYGGCYDLQCPTLYHTNVPNASFVTCFEHAQQIYFDSCAYANALEEFCIGVDDPCNYYNICGAIDEITSLSSFTVSPNPATYSFKLSLEVKNSDRFVISVLTLEGKSVYSTDFGTVYPGSYTKELSVSGIPNGFYLVECRAPGGVAYQKLLVQNR